MYFSSELVVDFLQHYKKQTSVGAFWLKMFQKISLKMNIF